MTFKVIRGQGQGEEMTSVPYWDYFTYSWAGSEYCPECSDAVQLGSKAGCGSFHSWINVWVTTKLCDPLLAGALGMNRDKGLYRSSFTLFY